MRCTAKQQIIATHNPIYTHIGRRTGLHFAELLGYKLGKDSCWPARYFFNFCPLPRKTYARMHIVLSCVYFGISYSRVSDPALPLRLRARSSILRPLNIEQ